MKKLSMIMYPRIYYYLLFSLFLLVVFACKDNPTSSDDERPSVSIVFPANNSEFPGDTVIPIKVDASDNESVKEVKFYIDGELESTDKIEPYRYEWDTGGKVGSHTIKAKAYDASNNMGESEVVSLKINATTNTGIVIDIDGNVYQTVKIGNKWWMMENLKVTHYRNGEAIPNVTEGSQWQNLTTGAYCEYDNNINNVPIYGRLYNWYAVADSRNIAPAGWHVPTDDEWKELEMYLGMSQSQADSIGWRGTDEGGKLKEAGTTHWNSPNTGATNSCGFFALPGGYLHPTGFLDMGSMGHWWSSTIHPLGAWARKLNYNNSQVYNDISSKFFGFSLRCVRD